MLFFGFLTGFYNFFEHVKHNELLVFILIKLRTVIVWLVGGDILRPAETVAHAVKYAGHNRVPDLELICAVDDFAVGKARHSREHLNYECLRES